MSENPVKAYTDHWNSVNEFHQHRRRQIEKELEFPDHWSYRAAQESRSERLRQLLWIVLLSTLAAALLSGLAHLVI